jgi:hypothetical protein
VLKVFFHSFGVGFGWREGNFTEPTENVGLKAFEVARK